MFRPTSLGRRKFAKIFGLGGALAAAGVPEFETQTPSASTTAERIADDLHSAIVGYEMDDTHCHASNDRFAQVTPEEFLLNIALAAMPQAAYFPAGILQQWRGAAGSEKAKLDQEYGIQKKLDEITYHIRESIFLKYLTKELANFLGCAPKFETVIAARNE